MPEIRVATTADLPVIGRVLAAAFEDDPVWNWLVPSRDVWGHQASSYFARDAQQRIAHGGVLMDAEATGAALWAPPDLWKATPGGILREVAPALRLFRHRLPRALRTLTYMEQRHPKQPPHWYLAVLGTHPDQQGKGVGSALIRHVLDRCDEEGLPAYLESSKERNVPFYARHGFEAGEPIQLPGGGPPVWPMWREPAG
ncbi:MAG: GCN5-related N-acetyltransferase [Acidimicrobiales bacterium]|nr:GCN5-related N-acetyltransferase [Acidimicrobiales bacterium]